MQVERMDGVSGEAKATETARTERLAMGKTGGEERQNVAICSSLETENSFALSACVSCAQKAVHLLSPPDISTLSSDS